MPPRYDRIPPLPQLVEMAALIEELNARIDEMNRVFSEVALAESKTRGNDGLMPEINTTLDMNGSRIIDAGRSQRPADVVTRIELEEIGLFTNDGSINFSSSVNFSDGATTTGGSAGPTSITTAEVVIATAASATEGLVATNVSGDTVSVRDDGVNGTTEGTLAMARNGNGRADFMRVNEGQLVTTDLAVLTMLTLIYDELRRLNGDPISGELSESVG